MLYDSGVSPRDRIRAFDCASHSKGASWNGKNWIRIDSACFDRHSVMTTYDSARILLECYKGEGEAFVRLIIKLDEIWAKSYEPKPIERMASLRVTTKIESSSDSTDVKVVVILVYHCDGSS